MSDEPLEPDHVEYLEPDRVEYLEPQPFRYEEQKPRTYVYSSSGPGCCGGCGCFIFALFLISAYQFSSIFSAVIMVIVAAWLSRILLQLAGVRRVSSAYVYAVVPLFLTMIAVLFHFVRGQAPYTWREIVIGTLAVYLFIFLANRRRKRAEFH